MAYELAWVIYILMAAFFMFAYERLVAPALRERRQLRLFLRALTGILLFTPGIVLHEGVVYPVPACVGVMFNILAHKPLAILQAMLPLLFVSSIVFGILLFRESRRKEA